MIDKLNDQGELISAIIKQASEVSGDDNCKKHEDLAQKCDELENRLQEKATNLEKRIDDNKKVADQNDVLQKQLELEIKTKAVEDQFNEKCSDLDKKCDEVRQRSLKGNLIVSSPARTTSGGHTIPSLVKHEMFWDRYGNWRCETG